MFIRYSLLKDSNYAFLLAYIKIEKNIRKLHFTQITKVLQYKNIIKNLNHQV
jgi:hypothetical protein